MPDGPSSRREPSPAGPASHLSEQPARRGAASRAARATPHQRGDLIHTARPRVTSPVTGRTKADHGLVIAVHDGWGYAEYSDSRRHCQTLGDPDSEWHTTQQGHFLPGSGILVDQLTAIVIEFLNTAELPESVQWRDLTPPSR